jgi:hypothetical protein
VACDRLSFAQLQWPPLGWRSAGGACRNHTGARIEAIVPPRSANPMEARSDHRE